MIEINELAIQMTIADTPAPSGNAVSSHGLTEQSKKAREALIADCVQSVLRILGSRGDR